MSAKKKVLLKPAHNINTTFLQRFFDVLMSFQRPYNIVLASRAGLVYLEFFFSTDICLFAQSFTDLPNMPLV